jgi:3-oxoacyl-[acyl-carrier protein] reductase
MEDAMELKGKTAIVTGSGGGIGQGIAEVFAREGANVVAMDRSGKGADVAKKITAAGGKAISVIADVTDKKSLDTMVASTLKQFGGIDILVNNAGIEAPPCLLVDLTEEQWNRVLGVNLTGVFLCCKAVLPTMIAKGSGRIINISSIAGIRMTFFGGLEYTVSKHGITGLTQHLAWELADSHITVNAVCPGMVLTPLGEKTTTPEFREMARQRMLPLGRFQTVEDIGEAVSFLASDRAAMITGQMLAVDGGELTGYGEDLRPLIRKRMQEIKAKATHS